MEQLLNFRYPIQYWTVKLETKHVATGSVPRLSADLGTSFFSDPAKYKLKREAVYKDVMKQLA